MDWLFSHLPKLFDGVTAVGIVAGLFALTKLAVEYSRDNRRKRMELYLALREYFRTNERFGEIFEFLDGNISTDVFESEVNADTRAEFASFLEDVAMCVSSGELKPDVAHYMFGYYVIRCWENEVFWNGLEQDSIYWALVKGFYEEMKNQRKILEVAHPIFLVVSNGSVDGLARDSRHVLQLVAFGVGSTAARLNPAAATA